MSVMNFHTVLATVLVLSQSISIVNAHIALFHPAMWGFNTNGDTPTPLIEGDNRPVIPLYNRTFEQWWFHGLLSDPPEPDAILQMPVGQTTVVETVCDKGASTWWNTSAGHSNVQTGDQNYPCPGYPTSQFHTNGIDDLGGCAISIAYKSDVNDVTPDDFVIISVNHTCVWTRFTAFDIPAEMPPCPGGKCICAWHWIHNSDSGSEQMYMTGVQCNMQGATGTKGLGTPQVPTYCPTGNCTTGAKSPMWWLQAEGNNMFNDYMNPPTYVNYFKDGAQNDIFGDSPVSSYPTSTDWHSTSTTTSTSTSTSAPPQYNKEPVSSPAPTSTGNHYAHQPPSKAPPRKGEKKHSSPKPTESHHKGHNDKHSRKHPSHKEDEKHPGHKDDHHVGPKKGKGKKTHKRRLDASLHGSQFGGRGH